MGPINNNQSLIKFPLDYSKTKHHDVSVKLEKAQDSSSYPTIFFVIGVKIDCVSVQQAMNLVSDALTYTFNLALSGKLSLSHISSYTLFIDSLLTAYF